MKKIILNDVLFEIGTEELPATNLADLVENAPMNAAGEKEPFFVSRLKKILEEKRIGFGALRFFATPRRLVFLIEKIMPDLIRCCLLI